MLKTSNKFQLRYSFDDESHAMNAIVRNICERELLQIFNEVINVLDLDIELECDAFTERGLHASWKFAGENNAQVTLVLAAIFEYLDQSLSDNKDELSAQMDNLKRDNKLIKAQLKELTADMEGEKAATDELVQKVVAVLNQDYKLIWYRSNFFKKVNAYSKVVKINTARLNEDNKVIGATKTINKKQFQRFILRSDKLPPNVDENASIELIAPVLREGKYQWKGLYNGDVINFEMGDDSFKASIYAKQIDFAHGSTVQCVLSQTQKMDELGQVKITRNEVITVIEYNVKDGVKETEQGKKFKKVKEVKMSQLTLAF